MKVAIGSVVVAAAVSVFVATPALVHAAAPQTTTTTPDSTLDKRIEKRIHDSSLKKYDIKVSADHGVATLTATVPIETDRRKVAQLATVPGVARVDNRLIVDLNAAETAPKGTTGKVEKGEEAKKVDGVHSVVVSAF